MSFFRRVLRSLFTSKTSRKMSELNQVHSTLFETLFPGETYSADRGSELASKLREIASQLKPSSVPKPSRDLDFDRYQQRYVALEVMYIGHDYFGFARQANILKTVEEHLFAAMIKTRLIPPESSSQELRYTRGGRTDKGVSGLGQVVALLLRSAARSDQPSADESREYDYPAVLNSVLPANIRVLGWTTAPEDFSARFSAIYREYKYFIVDDGKLNVEKMIEGGQYLIGEHDFRNLCKPDVTAVKNFIRKILEVRVEEVPQLQIGRRRVLELYVKGTAFLWHQIRCIAAVLLMIGRGEEEPEIFKTLLDVERTPRKPHYGMASEEPLLLFSCSYSGLNFRRSWKTYREILEVIDNSIYSHLTRAALLHCIEVRMLQDTLGDEEKKRPRPSRHIPLMERSKGLTVEEMVERCGDKVFGT